MARATSADARAWSASLGFVLAGLIAAIVYLFAGSPLLVALMFTGVGLGSAAAILAGTRRYRPAPGWPWLCLAAACVAFLAGALLRPWSERQTGAAQLLADACTVPGYALLFAGLAGFLLRRQGTRRHLITDGLLIGIGATITFAVLFSVPAAAVTDRPTMVSVLAAGYPILDGILILLLLNLAFATQRRGPSFFMLVGSLLLMLVGDIAYAIIGATGQLTGSRLLDLPFLLGFTVVGGAALHPTMTEVGHVTRLPVQAWSLSRLLLIVPALTVPFVIMAITEPAPLDRLIIAVGGATMVGLLLFRGVSAVQAYAAAQRRYEYQATHDELSGLANRALLFTQVRAMLAQATSAQPVWMYFLDLDGFKLVNDSRGHNAGDQVLVDVSRRLLQALPSGVVVARAGGDEFVFACRADRDEAIDLAEGVLRVMRQAVRIPTADVVMSASIGIACSANAVGAATPEGLLRDADTAMYQAKAQGRDTWAIFDPVMHDKVRERIDVDMAMRTALNESRFRLAYQPIVHLPTGRLVGAEALIRWEDPQRGQVSPVVFIPIAEESGLIVELGRWVMRESLRQLAGWRADGVVSDDFWMSVNVSPRQLRDSRLSDDVASTLAEFGLPGSVVMIELTESVMIDVSSGIDRALRSLRELDIRLVVDDFGTGYSALGYLRKHPITGVKIDQSFVAGLGANPEDEEIVRAVVAMSSALNLSVVAEGVEHPHQQQVLKSLGVTHGQGWLWGKPVDPQSFVRRWSRTPTIR